MPLARRLPKRGFTNIFAKEYTVVNVGELEKLENGSVPLEESMKLFEEGTKLANFCNSKLNAAEQKFTQLITENSESDNNE